jgi:hypothetical protein
MSYPALSFKVFLFISLMYSSSLLAQLNSGDVVFSGYSSDVGADGFSIVVTTTISAGEVIHFTDNGWLSGTNTFRTGEGFVSYTVPAGGLSLGDQVSFIDLSGVGNAYVASDGGSLLHNGSLNPALAGDQIFAFSGTVTNSTTFTVTRVIAGLQFRGTAFDADATSSNTSALPPDLTLGTDAVVMRISRDNGRLSFDTNLLSSTAAAIKARACDNSVWDLDNDIIYDLPPLPENTWNGSAWSSGSNPTADQNAVISSGQPITISSNLTVGEVMVESGATLTVDDGVILTISGGDLTNEGTFSGTGTISFSNNANISRTRGNALEFEGIIDVETGTTLETNDRLRLTASSAASYGMISGGGTIDGNVSMQCYLDLTGGASDGRYYHLSSPIIDTDFDDFNEGQILNVVNNGNGSVWQWDASVSNWAAPTSSTTTVESGRGYAIYAGSNASGDFTIAEAGTIELTGTVAGGNIDQALSYNDGQALNVTFVGGTGTSETEGWNFVGNPYPSQYNWDGQSLPSGLNDAIYIFDGTASYATYISGVGTNSGTPYIAPFQGFWVQTTNSSTPGTLTFADAQRVTSESTELFKTNVVDGVYLKAIAPDSRADEMFVGFDSQASLAFDSSLDAWKLLNANQLPNLYSKVGAQNYSINRVKIDDLSVFELGFDYEQDGASISMELNKQELKSYGRVILQDLKTSTFHDFNSGNYTFSHDKAFGSDRFLLHFSELQAVSQEESVGLDWYTYAVEGGLMLNAPSATDATVEVYNMAGQLIRKYEHVSSSLKIEIGSKGLHIIHLTEGNQRSVQKAVF